jgi:hypothetical protein
MRAKEPLCDSTSAAPDGDRARKARADPEGGRSPQDPTGTGEDRPLLMVDIDGVISLFGPHPTDQRLAGGSAGAISAPRARRLGASTRAVLPDGSFHAIDGIPHFLSSSAASHLLTLGEDFDLVWASGWEEKAEEYLPHLLGLPAGLPFLRFARGRGAGSSLNGHWKLGAIDSYAGTRPLAWIDDAFDRSCHAWAAARPAPTLLAQTNPAVGLTSTEAELLMAWARELAPSPV